MQGPFTFTELTRSNLCQNHQMIKGISHITLICRDLDKSSRLFCELFGAVEVYSSGHKNFSISKEKFLLIGSLWMALMEGNPLERSYNHIAFHIEENDLPLFESKIAKLGLDIAPSRPRGPQEGKSVYFYDYDNHLFELHTGDLATRLNHYNGNGSLKLRAAAKSEIEWVNQCYDEVKFVHSNLESERIAIAEFEGQKAGLGRLVTIDEQNLELGGMYVLQPFQGKGIAKKIVEFLLEHVGPLQTVYCIPFDHLLSFYKQFGFTACSNLEAVPKELLEKVFWCKENYTQPTSLLVRPC